MLFARPDVIAAAVHTLLFPLKLPLLSIWLHSPMPGIDLPYLDRVQVWQALAGAANAKTQPTSVACRSAHHFPFYLNRALSALRSGCSLSAQS